MMACFPNGSNRIVNIGSTSFRVVDPRGETITGRIFNQEEAEAHARGEVIYCTGKESDNG